jgi:hypothetical protein
MAHSNSSQTSGNSSSWQCVEDNTSEQAVQTSPSLLASAVAAVLTQNITVATPRTIQQQQLNPSSNSVSISPPPLATLPNHPLQQNPFTPPAALTEQNPFRTLGVMQQIPFPTAATTTALAPAAPVFDFGSPPGFDNQWNNQMPITPLEDRIQPVLPEYLQTVPGHWDPWCRLCWNLDTCFENLL